MKLYLAGPMRGIPSYNFPAFAEATADLRARGHEVWSPAENDITADGFNPETDTAQPMRHYMARDLPAVLDADAVAVLSGWRESSGCRIEVFVAESCGIPVLDAVTLDPITDARSQFWRAVCAEIDHAYAKHGREPWGRHEFYAIMREEVDEVWDEIKGDTPTPDLLKEVVQVAAMCLRYSETGDRYRGAHPAIPSRALPAPRPREEGANG